MHHDNYSKNIKNIIDKLTEYGITVLTDDMSKNEIVNLIFSEHLPKRMFVYLGSGDKNTWWLCSMAALCDEMNIDIAFETMKESGDDIDDIATEISVNSRDMSFGEYIMHKNDKMFLHNFVANSNYHNSSSFLCICGICDNNRNVTDINRYIHCEMSDVLAHVSADFKYALINGLNNITDKNNTIDKYERIINVCKEMKDTLDANKYYNYSIISTIDIRALEMPDNLVYDNLTLTCMQNNVKIVRRKTNGDPAFLSVEDMKNYFNENNGTGMFLMMDQPKGGKTWEMCGIAVDSIKAGHNTLFINFETMINELQRQMMAHYCKLSMKNYLFVKRDNADIFIGDISNISAGARLDIKTLDINSLTVEDIENEIQILTNSNGYKYDTIIIDDIFYINFNNSVDIHEKMKNIIFQLKNMSVKNKCNIFCTTNLQKSEWY